MRWRELGRILAFAMAAAAASPHAAAAQSCPQNPDALGTSRVLLVDPAATPRVGLKHFPQTLPLADKEVVLTFDDGPWPGTTPRVLEALRQECVRASFFLVGRNAAAHPDLVRRERAEGHTVAHHTNTHALLDRIPVPAAQAEIERGIAADEAALGLSPKAAPDTPFFRFPGFASSPALLDWLASRKIAVFGADLWASDWNPMTPETQLALTLSRLDAAGRGIVLFHDTKSQTAAMIPAFLRALKTRGYRVVHVVPPGRAGDVAAVKP